MDGRIADACADVAARLRALHADAEANLTAAERRELVEIALAVKRLVRRETSAGVERAVSTGRGAAEGGRRMPGAAPN